MNMMTSTKTALDTTDFSSIRIEDVMVRGVLCEAHFSYQADAKGDYTLIELVTAEIEGRDERTDHEGGEPMADVFVEGHVSTVVVMKVLIDVARCVAKEAVVVEWVNAYGQVA